MKNVRPKKKLGQHFLTDLNIAKKIADLLDYSTHQNLLEIGPGTGSFFVLAFIVIKGANIMQSTAITKLLNFSSNFAAFIIFAFQGYVIWYLGLTMAVAQIAGAYTGSKFAIKNGEKVVRPVLVIVSILLSLRILLG